jgi:hypothetical protein
MSPPAKSTTRLSRSNLCSEEIPMKVTNQMYPIIFWAVLILFSLLPLLPDNHGLRQDAVWSTVVNLIYVIGSLVLCNMRCSTPVLSYTQAQSVIAASYMTGCANISLPIVFVVFFIFHVIVTLLAIASFAIGKRKAQRKFLRIAAGFSRGRFAADEAIAAAGLDVESD